jgi:1-acyl-sn-glycerol-3-phosphate acyltransferase
MSARRYRPSLLRTALVVLELLVVTTVLTVVTILSAPFTSRVPLFCARLWSSLWVACAGARVRCVGRERLDRSRRYVFVCNHQSALDIPLLYVTLPFRLCFIAKRELLLLPVFGWGAAALGHIYIDRGNARRAHASVATALEKLRRGRGSLVIFPEGTRSSDGAVQPFKTGSFHLAIEAGVELVPVAIRDSRMVLPKHSFLHGPGPVLVEVGAPITVDGLSRADKAALAERVQAVVAGMAGERSGPQTAVSSS